MKQNRRNTREHNATEYNSRVLISNIKSNQYTLEIMKQKESMPRSIDQPKRVK